MNALCDSPYTTYNRRMADLKVIETFPDYMDAIVAKSYLESHDIPVFAHGAHHAGIDWMMQTALQGVRLMTVPSALEAAQNLLRELPTRKALVDPPFIAEVTAGAVTAASMLTLGPFFAMFLPIWRRWMRLFRKT